MKYLLHNVTIVVLTQRSYRGSFKYGDDNEKPHHSSTNCFPRQWRGELEEYKCRVDKAKKLLKYALAQDCDQEYVHCPPLTPSTLENGQGPACQKDHGCGCSQCDPTVHQGGLHFLIFRLASHHLLNFSLHTSSSFQSNH